MDRYDTNLVHTKGQRSPHEMTLNGNKKQYRHIMALKQKTFQISFYKVTDICLCVCLSVLYGRSNLCF